MPEFTATDVKALRDATGAGMMDAKRALTESDGDPEAAAKGLREAGLAKADKRSDRENVEGAISLASNGSTAALVELKCETDFSAKAADFIAVADEMADAVLAHGAGAVDGFTESVESLQLSKKENIEVGRVSAVAAADGNLLDTYVHRQDGRGVNAVIVEGGGIDADLLHQVALHIAFAKPDYLSRDEVPADVVETQRAAALETTKAEGKPEQAWDKIVEGRVNGWFKDRVLLDQGMHGEKTSVQDSIGSGTVVRYVQAYLGS
jgi:elongation factor Ts